MLAGTDVSFLHHLKILSTDRCVVSQHSAMLARPRDETFCCKYICNSSRKYTCKQDWLQGKIWRTTLSLKMETSLTPELARAKFRKAVQTLFSALFCEF